jgi:hypothetical protein
MSIEALYPSRRYVQRNNPLLRRELRRHRLIVAAALGFCLLVVGVFHIFPDDASAAGRTENPTQVTAVQPVKHIRVIPLYHIPPEQAGGALSYQD